MTKRAANLSCSLSFEPGLAGTSAADGCARGGQHPSLTALPPERCLHAHGAAEMAPIAAVLEKKRKFILAS